MRGDNVTPVKSHNRSPSEETVCFASKVHKRKIVEVNGEWKLY